MSTEDRIQPSDNQDRRFEDLLNRAYELLGSRGEAIATPKQPAPPAADLRA